MLKRIASPTGNYWQGIGVAALTGLMLQLTGCAGSTTFTAYPKKVEPLVSSISSRQELDLSKLLLDERGGADGIL